MQCQLILEKYLHSNTLTVRHVNLTLLVSFYYHYGLMFNFSIFTCLTFHLMALRNRDLFYMKVLSCTELFIY